MGAAPAMARSWSRSSEADPNRWPGSLAIERASTKLIRLENASSPGSCGTGALRCAIATSTSVPWYGGRPVRVSWSRQPTE